ncbi:unnamed protein product [Fraxinus pennsylvanica]|uniref:Uncharacterized protein n=1 Tax=Fraxinus pennsylvanica TaxID=56036 RepID=A0AAD1ZK51_9LAMI|nr:unnamed protein product [Fraxinus pennsylvanica]
MKSVFKFGRSLPAQEDSKKEEIAADTEGCQEDVVAGDGTNTVFVIAGARLKASLTLLSHGIHPTVVSDALHKAWINAVEILTTMAILVELSHHDSLVKSASTSLDSKVVSILLSFSPH